MSASLHWDCFFIQRENEINGASKSDRNPLLWQFSQCWKLTNSFGFICLLFEWVFERCRNICSTFVPPWVPIGMSSCESYLMCIKQEETHFTKPSTIPSNQSECTVSQWLSELVPTCPKIFVWNGTTSRKMSTQHLEIWERIMSLLMWRWLVKMVSR